VEVSGSGGVNAHGYPVLRAPEAEEVTPSDPVFAAFAAAAATAGLECEREVDTALLQTVGRCRLTPG